MALKINIETNFPHLQSLMNDLGDKDVTAATRASLNNSVRRGREQGSRMIRSRINLKATEIKKRITIQKARGGSLRSLEASLTFSGIPISMIHFIVGNKNVIKQKGVPVKKRRKLKARIRGNKKISLGGAFIQDMQSKQVFRHKGKGRRSRKLSTKSLARIILEDQIRTKLDEIVEKRFSREFQRQIHWRWEKSYSRFNKKPLKRL